MGSDSNFTQSSTVIADVGEREAESAAVAYWLEPDSRSSEWVFKVSLVDVAAVDEAVYAMSVTRLSEPISENVPSVAPVTSPHSVFLMRLP